MDARAAALLTLMCAVWAAGQVATKIGLAGISPNWQAGLRSAGSALLVIAWARYRGAPLFRRDGTAPAGVLCGALFSLEFALLFVGLEYTTAARGVIFLYTAPFFVAIGAHLLIPGDRLTRPKVAGLSCAFCGVLLAVWSGLALPSREEMLGDLLCFLAAAAWASTTICVKTTKLATTSPEKTLLYQLGVAAIALPVLGMLFGERGVFDPTAPVIAAFLFQMIFVTFATFLAWFWLISIYPATRLSAFTFLTPVIGVILGHIMLGEQVTVLMGLSLALIAAGIFLVNRPAAA
ncbi:MAG: DMT family transporter [Rhizobiales bacterium]|nr:DMT family transporter [Hyphomicrobiales bacterium]